jgi:hypothetical protein
MFLAVALPCSHLYFLLPYMTKCVFYTHHNHITNWPKFAVVVKVGESIDSLINNQIIDSKSLSNIYFIIDKLQEVRALRGCTLCSIKVFLNEVVHRILEVSINKRHSSAGVTNLEPGVCLWTPIQSFTECVSSILDSSSHLINFQPKLTSHCPIMNPMKWMSENKSA